MVAKSRKRVKGTKPEIIRGARLNYKSEKPTFATSKWFWLGTFLLIVFILFFGMLYLVLKAPKNPLREGQVCVKPVNLVCLGLGGRMVVQEKIPCKSKEDCMGQKILDLCAPSKPTPSKCGEQTNFCGEDGYCKQCSC